MFVCLFVFFFFFLNRNDRLEPKHYKSVKKTFHNEFTRVIGHRNNIMFRTGGETCLST